MRIAIMQPYFIPYAGYFRLFSATDLFVIYDCVQFPRRGWLHRNRLITQSGEEDWITLPIKKAPRDTTMIKDLQFAADAKEYWDEETRRFKVLADKKQHALKKEVLALSGTPLQYIVNTLKMACESLGVPFNVVYSSKLKLPQDLKGQDRILAICKHYEANEYVNSPGGRELYNHDDFKKKNIELRFLSNYQGNKISIMERIMKEDAKEIKKEIDANSILES